MGEAFGDDLLSILVRDFKLSEMMSFTNGNLEILDRNHDKIKFRFQNILIKYGNNRKKLQEEFFNEFRNFFEILKKDHKEVIYEGFEIEVVNEPIYEEYLSKF